MNLNEEDIPGEVNIDFAFPNFQLVIINDLGTSFSPFISFNIYETPLSFRMKTVNKDISFILESLLQISSSYYNSQINRWEPIIEKIQIIFDVAYDTSNKPNLIINVENELQTEKLNLNFSTEMLKSVVKGIRFIQESTLMKGKQENTIENVKKTIFFQGIYY